MTSPITTSRATIIEDLRRHLGIDLAWDRASDADLALMLAARKGTTIG